MTFAFGIHRFSPLATNLLFQVENDVQVKEKKLRTDVFTHTTIPRATGLLPTVAQVHRHQALLGTKEVSQACPDAVRRKENRVRISGTLTTLPTEGGFQ